MAVAKKLGTCSLARQFQRVSPFETSFQIRTPYAFEDGNSQPDGNRTKVHRRRGQYMASRTPDKRVKARFDTFDSAVDNGRRFLGNSANYDLAQMELKLRFPY